jgi:hypothetical protein
MIPGTTTTPSAFPAISKKDPYPSHPLKTGQLDKSKTPYSPK